jgi:hypothetical protein
MLTNLVRAKMSTHALTVAVAVMATAAHQFFSDPHAATWLQSHWVLRNLYETVGATLVTFGIYRSPTPAPTDTPPTN